MGFREQMIEVMYFRGTREKSLKLKGTGEQRHVGGTGNIEKIKILILGNKGNYQFFSGKQGNR